MGFLSVHHKGVGHAYRSGIFSFKLLQLAQLFFKFHRFGNGRDAFQETVYAVMTGFELIASLE